MRWIDLVINRPRSVFWIVVIVVSCAGLWGFGVMSRLSVGGFNDPHSESSYVDDFVRAHLGSDDIDVVALYTAEPGRTVDSLHDSALATLNAIDRKQLAAPILSYWSAPEPIRSSLRSANGTSAIATFALVGDDDTKIRTFRRIREALAIPGATVQLGGYTAIADAYDHEARVNVIRAELISFPVVLILLLIVFGGFIAAAIPLSIGGIAVLGSFFALRLIALVTEVSGFAVNTASLLGLGLAIDYSLFMVSRFREELREGRSPADAVRSTMFTAGRTVLTSAMLVECALSGMLFFKPPLIRSLAYGGMAAIAMASFVTLTALPSALVLLGPRINALVWKRGVIDRSETRAVRFWSGVAGRVVRRPVVIAAVVSVVLVLCALPLTRVKIGDLDHTGLPHRSSPHVVAERVSAEFPLLQTATARILLQRSDGGSIANSDLTAVAAAAARVDGIGRVAIRANAGSYGVINVFLRAPDRTPEALRAIDSLRDLSSPSGVTLKIGGRTAISQDGILSINKRVPFMVAFMLAATLLLMLLGFGSVVLAVKAVVLALVSLGASFGVLTWIFIDGHGSSYLGVTAGPLVAMMTLLIVALVFGLSTDYEVFLLSRMIEAHNSGADTAESVCRGIGRTGRLVTAAALLLIAVTAAFSISGLAMMRLLGVGVIVALFIDVTIVRMLLVPALVTLMGRANWWAPGYLGRRMKAVGDDHSNRSSVSVRADFSQ